MSSPYTPPSAPVRDVGPPKGSPVKAVIYGLLVDIGGSLLAGIVLTFVYAAGLSAEGLSAEQAAAAMANIPSGSWITVIGLIAGGLFSIAGGYVCARTAKRSEYGLGAIVAVLASLTGLMLSAQQYSAGVNALLTVVTFVAVMIGVRLGVARNARG